MFMLYLVARFQSPQQAQWIRSRHFREFLVSLVEDKKFSRFSIVLTAAEITRRQHHILHTMIVFSIQDLNQEIISFL